MESDPVLRVEGAHAAYRRKEILRGLSLEVRRGELVVVIGTNGSGKSTLLRVIAGLLGLQSGAVRLDGASIMGLAAHQRNRLGIGYLLQGGEVFRTLTVEENLELASTSGGRPRGHGTQRAYDVFPALHPMRRRKAGWLSGGERQMLAIGMVLSQQPRVLLLDEPSAGLAPAMVRKVIGEVSSFAKNAGISTLLVEQNVRTALTVADRLYSIHGGIAEEVPLSAVSEEEDLVNLLVAPRTATHRPDAGPAQASYHS